ncbi:Membrane attack complex component/perforin MACPF domain [Fusarium oxysporum f. sp. vasinfectum]|uniref:MACPF domain-containing protein n=1 Tax=Fusarium oxysporum f. sp. vasinfectum 25433 TaxID=1089449 RepID=X0KYY8_FUSOX|nr:hypothetical protein FOTG_17677 [Fusarium oxysporum f. sp. vasinfectum 25433]KAK2922531.1 Membrane attack complex component/perforin MACPF domain [Fusarium oxysporum f. sp. vasinfectum]
MSGSKLPSCDFLGRSVVFRPGDDIFDVRALIDRSDKHVIVGLRYGDRTEKIPGNSYDYAFPANASISRPGSGTLRQSLVVETGSSLSRQFEAKAELSVNYAGVSVSGNASYSNRSSFKSDSMYGLWSLDQKTHSVFLDGDQTNNISDNFLQAVRNLPPWKPGDSSVRSQYQSFFRYWGTHYIKECFLGTRYQLRIVKEATSSDKKEEMSASIEAEYGSIVKAKGEVKSTAESAKYMRSCDTKCYVRGGEPTLAAKLADDPQDRTKFNAWAESRREGATDAIVNIRLEEFGTLLKNSSDQSHRRLGQQLSDAFNAVDMVTLEATLTMNAKRWSPANGEFSPVDARVWFSVSGPGISIDPISRQDCTLHEKTTTSFVANHSLSNDSLAGAMPIINYKEFVINCGINDTLGRYFPSGLPMSVRLKISGPASAGPVRFYFKTGCGEVSLCSPSQNPTFSVKKPDGKSFVEGAVELPNLLATGNYQAM